MMRKEQKSGKAEQKIVKHLERLGNRVNDTSDKEETEEEDDDDDDIIQELGSSSEEDFEPSKTVYSVTSLPDLAE